MVAIYGLYLLMTKPFRRGFNYVNPKVEVFEDVPGLSLGKS